MSLRVGLTPAGLRGGVEHQGEGFLSEHFHQTAAQISRRLQPLRQDLGQGQRSTMVSQNLRVLQLYWFQEVFLKPVHNSKEILGLWDVCTSHHYCSFTVCSTLTTKHVLNRRNLQFLHENVKFLNTNTFKCLKDTVMILCAAYKPFL